MAGFHEYIPVMGRPVAYGIGFLVLVLLAFTGGVADAVITVAHEGGHMITALMTGRGVVAFGLIGKEDRTDGGTRVTPIRGTGASDIIIGFAGYATPPVAGLVGAYTVAHGNSWGVLWAAIVLLGAVLLVRSNGLARTFTGLMAVFIFWAAVAGAAALQAAVAVGVVWLLLIGGHRRSRPGARRQRPCRRRTRPLRMDLDSPRFLVRGLAGHCRAEPMVRRSSSARIRVATAPMVFRGECLRR